MELDTISARLIEARTQQGKSVEDVSTSTHIGAHYLKAIESGDWDALREVYAVGYVREYARFLELSDAEEMARAFNLKFSHQPKLPLVDSAATVGNYNSKGLPRRQRGRKRRMSGRNMKIPGALLVIVACVIMYMFSFSSVPGNDKERLRNAYKGGAMPSQTEPQAPVVAKKEAPAPEPRVPVAYERDAGSITEERNYILHSETDTTVKIYNGKHRLVDTVPLVIGDVAFITVPENGYAAAAGNAEDIILYTEDMQENLGNISVLLPKQR